MLKAFTVRGTQPQIELAQQLICQRIGINNGMLVFTYVLHISLLYVGLLTFSINFTDQQFCWYGPVRALLGNITVKTHDTVRKWHDLPY